ncbi:MAG: hypothetical protein JWQ35_2579 [Bacteriovoracaceae bacterium]|nr:hypothetical protein [Bacteriovoracaceae bacterium]
MIYSLLLAAQLLGQSSDPFDYGNVYLAETRDRELPRFHLGVGYAFNISNSYLNLDSLTGTAQVRVWKYVSTGLFGQVTQSELSAAGSQLRQLEKVDLHAQIPTPRWGLFSLSYLQFMLGRWNVLNLMPLESELLFGGGAGVLNRGKDTNGPTENKFSYLWSVEHRFLFCERAGIFVSLFGVLHSTYLQSGIHIRFD